jgi:hypothetical protein
LNGTKERVCKFVVPRCDGAEFLEFLEEPLDEIAFAVEGEVGFALYDAIGFGRNDRGDATPFERRDQGVGIVSFVTEECAWLYFFEQWLGLADVGGLAGRKGKGNRITERIDDGVDFRRQSASGSADGLISALFFRAPALC